MVHIAIVGASGQIGKSLTVELGQKHDISIFSRSPDKLRLALEGETGQKSIVEVGDFSEFSKHRYDVIINAGGPGDPRTIRELGSRIDNITRGLDEMILGYVDSYPTTGYIFLSTGAIYGKNYEAAQDPNEFSSSNARVTLERSAYAASKYAAERRHRESRERKISDIRVFGFISSYMKLDSSFFLARVANSLVCGNLFVTDPTDFVRDYVGPSELATFIDQLIRGDTPNRAYDLFSCHPLTKLELLDCLAKEMGFRYSFRDERKLDDVTIIKKPNKISRERSNEAIGYSPICSSMQIVLRELTLITGKSS